MFERALAHIAIEFEASAIGEVIMTADFRSKLLDGIFVYMLSNKVNAFWRIADLPATGDRYFLRRGMRNLLRGMPYNLTAADNIVRQLSKPFSSV